MTIAHEVMRERQDGVRCPALAFVSARLLESCLQQAKLMVCGCRGGQGPATDSQEIGPELTSSAGWFLMLPM